LALVAGGIGQTPFLAVIREALRRRKYGEPPRKLAEVPSRITLCYGVRNVAWLAGVEEFAAEGIDLKLATDDGTHGHHGYVTELLEELIAGPHPPDRIFCCGPEPMMHATAKIAATANIPCWLSLETPMACGFGACFSCVTPIRQSDGGWDYRRVCVEGPVFPAEQIVF
jgi:dihydroorotate dehydrogenase electron transfer subunit